MKVNHLNVQLFLLLILSLIPWQGPSVFKISCPKDNARIVRNLVKTKWIPILEKYKVSLPIECPFHPMRDIFGPQEKAKHHFRPSQWTCGVCGQTFSEEKQLDVHFDDFHKGHINMAEDAVCLADYCDIMRCDVLFTQDPKSVLYPSDHENTGVEIWREASSYSNKALVTSGPRDLTKYTTNKEPQSGTKPDVKYCQKPPSQNNEIPDENNTSDDEKKRNYSANFENEVCQSDLVDSALPSNNKHQRVLELQKLKANCKPETLQKIKTKCEILVRDCIAGLLIQLSTKDFKEVEDELNRAVCWYLTCDRYWEDFHTDIRSFPWGLLCMIIMVLSLGICMCYYIIWVLFDTDDVSVSSIDRSTPSPSHISHRHEAHSTDGHSVYTEDYYLAPDKDNEYIYVSYPPDLKRRLLESCYNRTTRL